MKIRMIGHACLLIEVGGLSILTDPWLHGTAFANGWSQNPPPHWGTDDIECDVLWLSHEHPDHFSPSVLRSISPDKRSRIRLVVQATLSGAMERFLEPLGWKDMTVLEHRERASLAPNVHVTLHQFGLVDSTLAIEEAGRTVLVMNDAKPSATGLKALLKDVGPVDVLCDQYSLAAWAGNPGDTARFAARRDLVLGHLRSHVEATQPTTLIPFASSVRFCQPENDHMNNEVVTREMVEAACTDTSIVWLGPGQQWCLESVEVTGEVASARPPEPEPQSGHPPSSTEILELARRSGAEILEQTPRVLKSRLRPLGFASADDSFEDFALTADGLVRGGQAPTRMIITGDAARTAFGFRWGLETLSISGRFRLEGDETVFQRWKQVAAGVSAGIIVSPMRTWVTDPKYRRFIRSRGRDFAAELVTKVR